MPPVVWILNPNGLVSLQKEISRSGDHKSSRCSWSCDAQTKEKIKAFFLNPKLLTFLELQGISCIVFAHVTCNTSNQRERKKDDFVSSIYFCINSSRFLWIKQQEVIAVCILWAAL